MKFYFKKFSSLFFLLISVFVFFWVDESKAAWLGSYTYRRPITITNSGGALANYQILITLDTQALITGSRMQNDCDDIRITDSDETTLIDYWIDSSCNTTSTRIWIKVPAIPAGNKTIYVYYGDSGAASAMNGNNVFDFFDDFEDNVLDATKWDSYSATETLGYVHASPANGANSPRGIFSKQTFSQNSILEYYIQFTGDVGGQGTGWHGFFESWISGQAAAFTEGCNNPAWTMCVTQSNGGSTIISTGQDLTARWPHEKISWGASGSNYFAERFDGWTFANTINVNNPTANQKILFAATDWDNCCGYANIDMYIYWTGVRKYSSPEPTLVVGSEELPLPSCDSFTATPSTIPLGGSSTLSWVTTNITFPGDSITISDGAGYNYTATATPDNTTVSPSANTTYTLTATNSISSDTCTVVVSINAPTCTLSSSESAVLPNETVDLSWTAANATSGTINGINAVPIGSGGMTSSPIVADTSFSMNVIGPGGSGTGTCGPVNVRVFTAPIGGLVPCGRAFDDPNTTYDETEPCTLCHIFIMLQMISTFVVEIGGIIAVFFLVIGGLIYATSAGSQGRMETGKKAMMYALFGLAIILLSWLIVTVVLTSFGYINPLGGNWNVINCTVT